MWSFEDLNVKENSIFRRRFTCEFDSGMEQVSEVNKFCDFCCRSNPVGDDVINNYIFHNSGLCGLTLRVNHTEQWLQF